MRHHIGTGDSIVITIDGKALFGKVTDTRENSAGEPVIELELDRACGYKLVWE
jgi:hypothetical protein